MSVHETYRGTRLGEDEAVALISLSSDEEPPGDLLPIWGEVRSIMDDPECRILVEHADKRQVRTHRLWVTVEGLVGLMDVGSAGYDLVVASAQSAPRILADAIALSVRPRLSEGIVRVPDTFGDLTSADPELRQRAVADLSAESASVWPELGAALAAGGSHAYTIEHSALHEGELHTTVVSVVDTTAGIVVATTTPSGAFVCPSTPTDLWILLVELLVGTAPEV